MLIVDAQVHTWAASTPERPWPAGTTPHRPVPLGTDDLLQEMNAAGVDRAVLVPPSWEGARNDLALAAAQAYDSFGPQRMFWGTDLSRSPIPYRQQVTMFTEEIPWLTTEDKTWIMGRGICEWPGWPYQDKR